MQLLDNLRKIVDTKLNIENTNKEKYILIKQLLEEDTCFFNIKIDTAYSILEDLDFSKEEIPIIYSELTNPKAYLQTKFFTINKG